MRNICRVIGLGAGTREESEEPVWASAWGLGPFYLRLPPRVCRYVCPSIMATITRSVHSVSFFLCLPRLFHPSVLATVPSAPSPLLSSSPSCTHLRAHVYYIMRDVDPIPLKQRPSGVFIRLESLGGEKNAFGVESGYGHLANL